MMVIASKIWYVRLWRILPVDRPENGVPYAKNTTSVAKTFHRAPSQTRLGYVAYNLDPVITLNVFLLDRQWGI